MVVDKDEGWYNKYNHISSCPAAKTIHIHDGKVPGDFPYPAVREYRGGNVCLLNNIIRQTRIIMRAEQMDNMFAE